MYKKIKFVAALAAALLTAVPLAANVVHADGTANYSITGGRITVDFEQASDLNKFSRYSEFTGCDPYVQDGALYAWVLAEQKMIYKDVQFDDVRVDVDISTIGTNGKFDSGIYIGASGAKNQMDGITAWEVNIEHGPGSPTFWLKFHRFENDRWLRDEMVEIGGLIYKGDTMHLTVVVKDKTMYAFLDGGQTPVASKYIGNEARGMVGLRNFYAPCRFDNFSVTGNAITIDFAEMNALKTAAEAKIAEPIVQECKDELTAAIAQANAADTQDKADAATAALSAALDRVVFSKTLDELSTLVTAAGAITNDGKVYTANSYNALVAVKNICSELTQADGEYEISYWYARLDEKIKNLVKYNKEGV